MHVGYVLCLIYTLSVLQQIVNASKNDSTCSESFSHSEQLLTPDIATQSEVYAAAGHNIYAVTWIEEGRVKVAQQKGSVDVSRDASIAVSSNLTETDCKSPYLIVQTDNELLSTYSCNGGIFARKISVENAPVLGEEVLVANDSDFHASFLIRQGYEQDAHSFLCGQASDGNGSVACYSSSDGTQWEALDATEFLNSSEIAPRSALAAATNTAGQILVVYSINETTLGSATLNTDSGLKSVSTRIQVNSTAITEEFGNYVLSLASGGQDEFILAATSESGVWVIQTNDLGGSWSGLTLVVSSLAPSGLPPRIDLAFTNQYILAFEDLDGVSAITRSNSSNATWGDVVPLLDGATRPALASSQSGTIGYMLAALIPPHDVVALGCFSHMLPTQSPSGEFNETYSPTSFSTSPGNSSGNGTASPTSSVGTVTDPPSFDFAPPRSSKAAHNWAGIGPAMALLALTMTLTMF